MRYVAVIRDGLVEATIIANDGEPLAVIAEVNGADDVVDVTDLTPRPGPAWTWVDDQFRPPAPFDSWEWTGDSWVAPTPYPSEPGLWVWNEDTGSWDSVTPDTE